MLWGPLRAQRRRGAPGRELVPHVGLSTLLPLLSTPVLTARPAPTTACQVLPGPSFRVSCKSPRGQAGTKLPFVAEMSQPKLTAPVDLPSAWRPQGQRTEHRPSVHTAVCKSVKYDTPPPPRPATPRLRCSRLSKAPSSCEKGGLGPSPPAPAPGPTPGQWLTLSKPQLPCLHSRDPCQWLLPWLE